MAKATSNQFFASVGRRKTAIAQARITSGKGKWSINGKEIENTSNTINAPLIITGQLGKFDVSIIIRGGGFSSQEEAASLAIARALIEYDETLKSTLRKAGLVTRDPREKERKKPGLKRARKSPQWSKR